jgi:hypothetical protein
MLKDMLVNGNGGWVGVIARLGLPVVLSLGLTWFLVVQVSTSQATMIDNQHTIITNQADAKTVMTVFMLEQRQGVRQMLALMLQTCLNTAKAEAQQQACLAAVR